MMHAISLIYGEHVLDDLEFCRQHDEIIKRYSRGIMTLQSSPGETLEAAARDPARFPGWTHLLKKHPQDCAVLHGFLLRLADFLSPLANSDLRSKGLYIMACSQ